MADGQELAAPWVSTPGFLHDRARRIHSALTALNDVITALTAAHRLSTTSGRYKQWKALLANYGSWYGQTTGASWLWSGTDATLETYERLIRDWETWLRQAFPDTAPSLPTAPPVFSPDGKEREDVPWWVKVLAVGVGAYGAAKLLGKL